MGFTFQAGFLKIALRAKGLERAVLVTDAVMPAMCEPGRYTLGQVEVELRANGSVVITGTERLAGSALRMDRAIGNSVRLAGVSLHRGIDNGDRECSARRARGRRLRGLTTGEKADFVRFQWDPGSSILQVKETIVAGVSAYRA